MANYATLKAAIAAAIYTNTQRAITGDVLKAKMDEMIDALGAGYQYMGEATPSTNPGTPDCNVAYLATTAGTYPYFNLTLASGKIAFFRWRGSWMKDEISVQAELTVDTVPTEGSTNPVSSGGVYTALQDAVSDEQVERAVDAWLDDHKGEIDGLSYAAKTALLNLLQHVAYIDDHGREYYEALHDALFPPRDVASISATFNQGSAVIYDNDSLDTLRPYLTVVATYDDATTETVTDYTLAGELTTGTSTITVLYGGKSDTFDVTVTHATLQYTITNNLTQCTNSNAATTINELTAYSGALTANSGYVMESVIVTMGGNDITSTAYDNGTISIASVTGNIVITAVATEDVGWISGVPYDMSGYTDNEYLNNGVETSYSGWAISPYLPVKGAFIKSDTTFTTNYNARYDGNKTYLSTQGLDSSWPPISIRGEYIRVSDLRATVTGAVITPYKFPIINESTTITTDTWYTFTPITGKYVNQNNGVVVTDAGYDCSEYLNCFGQSTLKINQTAGNWGTIVFFDGNKNYMSGVEKRPINWTEAVTIPTGARYVRISCEAGYRMALKYA